MILTYIDGLVQDCNNFIVNALELLQSCAKSTMNFMIVFGAKQPSQKATIWTNDDLLVMEQNAM